MLPLLSVIMSVYNETHKDISTAIKSVLDQTYSNFELIIIIDNPNKYTRSNIRKLADDPRIRVYSNDRNIGLAMSMNRASEYAEGEFLVRMDADDVSLPERFQKQYEYLMKHQLDLVCSWFSYIDFEGKQINRNIRRYHDRNVEKLLPYANTIHHPTVMMKKKVFEESGRYRNFPCAQDYDLWLRIHEKKYKIGIVPEILLLYRMREKNTTSERRIQQYYTQVYSRMLYRERKQSGTDHYSIDNYNEFLNSRKIFDEKYVSKLLHAMDIKNSKGILYQLGLFLKYPFFRQYYKDGLRSRLFEKIL